MTVYNFAMSIVKNKKIHVLHLIRSIFLMYFVVFWMFECNMDLSLSCLLVFIMLIQYSVCNLYSRLFVNNGTGDSPRPLGICHNKTPVSSSIVIERLSYTWHPNNLFSFKIYHQIYTGGMTTFFIIAKIYIFLFTKNVNHKLVLSKSRNHAQRSHILKICEFQKKKHVLVWTSIAWYIKVIIFIIPLNNVFF